MAAQLFAILQCAKDAKVAGEGFSDVAKMICVFYLFTERKLVDDACRLDLEDARVFETHVVQRIQFVGRHRGLNGVQAYQVCPSVHVLLMVPRDAIYLYTLKKKAIFTIIKNTLD
jgi:hypothetical protein